jgi:hypothetical protein
MYSSPTTIIVPLHDNVMYTPSSTSQPNVVVVPLAQNTLYVPSNDDTLAYSASRHDVISDHPINAQFGNSMYNQTYDSLCQSTIQSDSGTYAVPLVDNAGNLKSDYYTTVTPMNARTHNPGVGHTIIGEYAVPLAVSEI